MIDPLSMFPNWLFILALPVAAFLLVIVWLLTRGSHSVIKLSGFGLSLELKDATPPAPRGYASSQEGPTDDLAN